MLGTPSQPSFQSLSPNEDSMQFQRTALLRYPGGKQRQLPSFLSYLPPRNKIPGRYIEPFVGGGAVFFQLQPNHAILSDINPDLIELYEGIRACPHEVWVLYTCFPETKTGYYEIRGLDIATLDLTTRAARTLFLNRTCFKGMWRHNAEGKFNVGYGGQARRWAISEEDLLVVSALLQNVTLHRCDFEEVIDVSSEGDFVFVDPPYRPGAYQMLHQHYQFGCFGIQDQGRLASALKRASKRGVRWAMTNSSHPNILALYTQYDMVTLPKGTGQQIGHTTTSSGEVLIRN